MYAVIFRAKAGKQDQLYGEMVAKMRDIAFEKYGCLDFIAVTENNDEIAISYWKDEESIKRWKSDSEHTIAQQLGMKKWYESYIVQVVEIKREYSFTNS
ncbi:antibiotic biosynthesis monooxygenase family protein [Thalassotalea sediminis]|uniref:antibiotic biosynthesis monooxygenase family protein n=1 Tax=Thalassotalea sediminis TaxID=1759089 RepID=UPI002572A84D|nr:antibiotic biosynthesis monooxygenase [Thalassotalea sediminis]